MELSDQLNPPADLHSVQKSYIHWIVNLMGLKAHLDAGKKRKIFLNVAIFWYIASTFLFTLYQGFLNNFFLVLPLYVIYKVSKLACRIWVILIANKKVKKKFLTRSHSSHLCVSYQSKYSYPKVYSPVYLRQSYTSQSWVVFGTMTLTTLPQQNAKIIR
jgi:hypothetical protein